MSRMIHAIGPRDADDIRAMMTRSAMGSLTHSPSATDFIAKAREAAVEEVDAMLKAADAFQDALNRVRTTGLAPVGVLELVERMARELPAFSNNCVSLMERAK